MEVTLLYMARKALYHLSASSPTLRAPSHLSPVIGPLHREFPLPGPTSPRSAHIRLPPSYRSRLQSQLLRQSFPDHSTTRNPEHSLFHNPTLFSSLQRALPNNPVVHLRVIRRPSLRPSTEMYILRKQEPHPSDKGQCRTWHLA